MERFHFHVEDGERYPDEEGTPLPGLAAARIEALKVLTQAVLNWPDDFWKTHRYSVTVEDDAGQALFTLSLNVQDTAAVAARPDRPA